MSARYSIGSMNQLGDALEAANFTPEDVTALRTSSLLATFREMVRGRVQFEITKHTIDLDAAPFVPKGWTVEQHTPGGQFTWGPDTVKLYRSPNQQGRSIEGNQLRTELEGQSVFNANMLDYFLAHPELIPDSWKEKYIYFWGTFYRDSEGYLYVRYLCWHDGRWDWRFYWLDHAWGFRSPAAVLASPRTM